MKIKLQEAIDLINAADVVKLNGYITPSISIEEINGDPINEVMYVNWEDEGLQFNLWVIEENNVEVERDGHKLTLIDDEGDPFELHLFREVPILP